MTHDPSPAPRTVVDPKGFASALRLGQVLLGDQKGIPERVVRGENAQIDTACRVLFAVHALNSNRQLIKTLRAVIAIAKSNTSREMTPFDVEWLEERLKILVPTL